MSYPSRSEKSLLRTPGANMLQPSQVPPIVQKVLRSPSQQLDGETRAMMEPRFGHDFSGVRVQTDVQAAESARTVMQWRIRWGGMSSSGRGNTRPG